MQHKKGKNKFLSGTNAVKSSNVNLLMINEQLNEGNKATKTNTIEIDVPLKKIKIPTLQIKEIHNSVKLINTEAEESMRKLAIANFSFNEVIKELAEQKRITEELNILFQNEHKIVNWYKATYEDRTLLGILKEKLSIKHIKKGSFNNKVHSPANAPTKEIVKNKRKLFLKSLFAKKTDKYQLKPFNDIIASVNNNEFTSVGTDPYFLIDFKKRKLKAGWYNLSVELKEIEGILFAPKLYFNYGDGFDEKNGWNLPAIEGGKIECLIHIPLNLFELRFDPTTTKSIFAINNFNLKSINKLKALQIGVLLYKKKYFPLESGSSFYKGLMETVLKNGVFEIREKIRHTVYLNGTNSWDKYKYWCSLYDDISKEQFNKIIILSTQLTCQPLFSIIMPVYNAPVSFLKKAIESVINQPYKNWELCIADDKSTNEEVKKLLNKYAQKDTRIKIVFRKTNGHISNASNSALKLATGDYIVLLDQDDELSAHCLYMVAKAINQNSNLGIIYSDEDKIDEYGNRFDPYFKTDWNIDLFYGQNMISHLGVYKTSLIKKIGGFRVGYEGSQDYDLALRCSELLKSNQIYHIPHVLYHWRAIKGSTAIATSNKDYAYGAAKRALQDHLKRTKQNASVVATTTNQYRVKWGMPDKKPLVSIIIPTKDKVDVLSTCITSILEKTVYNNYEVLIVDNNSEEPATHAYFKQIQKENNLIKVFKYNEEFNFSAMNNFGVKQAKGEIIILLNNDTSVINNDWLCEMVSLCLRKDIGAVGAKLFYPNGLIQHAGVFLHEGHPGNHIYINRENNDPGYFNKLNLIQNYVAVTAACLAVRKELYLEVGGLDDRNLKIAYNDVDFCLKIFNLGYRNIWTPFARLIHYESLSRGNDLDEINFPRFKKEQSFILNKWSSLISNDPFFNPNLGIETFTTQFSFPPKIRYEWDCSKENA